MLELTEYIRAQVRDLFDQEIEPELSVPEERFGDYSTNAALQLAGLLGLNPRQIAEKLAARLAKHNSIAKAEVAGPGFINLTLNDKILAKKVSDATKLPKPLAGQEILVEFGDPNPFKEMHIGHLYSYIVGDAIASLLEAQGARVRRLSYHGDVGLHVARAIYGLREMEKKSQPEDLPTIERENFLGKAYAYGADQYEKSESARKEIDEINQHVYKQDDPEINRLHKEGCELSFSYFDKILGLLDIGNDRRYLESQTITAGKALVEENIGKVFKKSQGAIVFKGEKEGLHTRVFITSKGLPTYETKDLGLAKLKNEDYPKAKRSIVITASEQSEYFKVMLAALRQINPKLASKTKHLAHGFLSLSTGKMSSRTGNVFPAMRLLEDVKAAVHKRYPDSSVRKEVTFAAVKYAFLKHRLGSDIVVNIEESIGLEGNSGPYLQYAHARARSILQKTSKKTEFKSAKFDAGERSLARKISEYPYVVAKAASDLMPHHVTNYLYELAQTFNSFYEANRVIGDNREAARLALVAKYADVLKHGLELLNIKAPEKM